VTGRRLIAPHGALRGTLDVPGDKSISHRAFLLGTLCNGTVRVAQPLESADIACSRRLAEAVGARVHVSDDGYAIEGAGEHLVEPPDVLWCGNSGTTMRIGAGVVSHAPGVRVMTGDASLRRRPMRRIVDPLRAFGLQVTAANGGTRAPLVVSGGPTHATAFDLDTASAQVKSALLLAGGRTGVRVREPRQSRDHTERMLHALGARLSRDADGWWSLRPSPWSGTDLTVPGDLSSAAFWLVAASIHPGSDLVLPGVGLNPTRRGVIDALTMMGADITIEDAVDDVEPRGTLHVRHAELRGVHIDGDLALSCLDELPVLAVAAALAEGETVIADASELRVKESDRIARVARGLRAMGIEVEERPDGMVIEGGHFSGPRPRIDAEGDHRLAMAFAVAGGRHPEGVVLDHASSVATSYPGFFDDLAATIEEGTR
jgi:3-phosphoshikimate 1-carboxyvinyltransferase